MSYRGAFITVLILLGADVVFADPLPGISATATSELVSGTLDRAAVHTVDGSGLLGVIHATSGEGRFWESVGIGAGFGADRAPAITFDLHDIFFLESMRIWNFAEANSVVRRAQVLASLDQVDFNSLGVQTFATLVNPAQDVSLNGVLARYIRLEVLENGGGTVFPLLTGNPGTGGFAGLGEVQFFGTAVPEPSSLILIGIGIAALLMGSRWPCGPRIT